MKLLFCPECQDLFKLFREPRTCRCGKASGAYEEDGHHAWHSGGIPIAFANSLFAKAIKNRPVSGKGAPFGAFVIPVECLTVQDRGGS